MPEARAACSAWSFVPTAQAEASIRRLEESLRTGAWDEEHGELRRQPSFEGSLVLVRALPA